ncbi:hypothetical protein D3C71_897080 [compost metagenome]
MAAEQSPLTVTCRVSVLQLPLNVLVLRLSSVGLVVHNSVSAPRLKAVSMTVPTGNTMPLRNRNRQLLPVRVSTAVSFWNRVLLPVAVSGRGSTGAFSGSICL